MARRCVADDVERPCGGVDCDESARGVPTNGGGSAKCLDVDLVLAGLDWHAGGSPVSLSVCLYDCGTLLGWACYGNSMRFRY